MQDYYMKNNEKIYHKFNSLMKKKKITRNKNLYEMKD